MEIETVMKSSLYKNMYIATRLIFNSLLGVWKCDQTRSFVFDMSLNSHKTCFEQVAFCLPIFQNCAETLRGLTVVRHPYIYFKKSLMNDFKVDCVRSVLP